VIAAGEYLLSLTWDPSLGPSAGERVDFLPGRRPVVRCDLPNGV
jgi:hypothetical protein